MRLSFGGGGIGQWGMPSPLFNYRTGKSDSDGLVWWGKKPPMSKDYAILDAKWGKGNYKVDERSLVGRSDPNWSTFFYENRRKGDYFQQIILGRR